MHTAVIIPCLNEAQTIGAVVDDFRRVLPEAEIVVIDNGSSDSTAEIAQERGATVLREPRRGKGHAVRKAFDRIDADAYLLVDGDGTYPAAEARKLLLPIAEGEADVVIGTRLAPSSMSEFRAINRLGNYVFLGLINFIFRANVSDLLTGYRAMSREFVRRSPVLSDGFELETELTVLALDRGFRTIELPVTLARRPSGSASKIRIFGDGLKILTALFSLLRDYRPLTFFGGIGAMLMTIGLAPGTYVVIEFIQTHEVRIPTAVLATGLEIVGVSSALTGVVLTTLARRFRELNHLVAALERDVTRLAADDHRRRAG